MRKLIIAGALFCGIAVKSYAQQASPDTVHTHNYSLAECISYAYQHQDSVLNAGLDVKSAEFKVKETIGQGLPQISGTASFQDYLQTPVEILPNFLTPVIYGVLHDEGVQGKNGTITVPQTSGNIPLSFYQKYNTNLGATLNQLLFDGSYLVGLKASKTYKELSQKSLIRTRIETAVSVTKAYYQVLVNDEQIKLLNANVAQLKQQLDETSAQNKQGFVELIDVQRLQVQYNTLLNTRDNTIRSLVLGYQLLKFQMGMPIGYDLTLKDKLEDVNLTNNLADLSTDTTFYQKRIEYSLSETGIRLNELALKRQKAMFLPSLSAVANTSILNQSNSFGQLFSADYPSTYIGINLSIPIFSGGQRINQVRESKIAVEKSQNDLYDLKNALALQASQARVNYTNGLKTLDIQKQNQALSAEVLRVAKIKYKQGVGSSIEVTQAETDLQNADNQYIQGLYNALTSKVDLDKAYGRIQ